MSSLFSETGYKAAELIDLGSGLKPKASA